MLDMRYGLCRTALFIAAFRKARRGVKFSQSAAAVRAVEQVMEEMKLAYQRASVALAEIPDPLRAAAIREIKGMAVDWAVETDGQAGGADVTVGKAQSSTLPNATRAIYAILEKHKEGLTGEQIHDALRGGIQTNGKAERVISSTLSNLKSEGKLLLAGGRYTLTGDQHKDDDGSLQERLVKIFRENGNAETSTADLANALEVKPNAVRSTFAANKTLFVCTRVNESSGQKWWKLTEREPEPEASEGNPEKD